MAKNKFTGHIERRFTLPNFALPQKVLEDVAKLAEQGIVENILKQQQADGKPLKRNPPGLTKAKIRNQRKYPTFSLIDKYHRFIQYMRKSWVWTIYGGGTTNQHISIKPTTAVVSGAKLPLSTIAKDVQMRGYVGWFAVGKKSVGAIKVVMANWIKSESQKASKGKR